MPNSRPNVIVFMTDDQGYGDLSCMGAEDFSYVLQQVPGSMAMLGVCPEGEDFRTTAPNHSNFMRINESALQKGVALYAGMALAG